MECGDVSPLSHDATCRVGPKRGHVRALHKTAAAAEIRAMKPAKLKGDPKAAAATIQKLTRLRPTLAMILGSGFQPAAQQLEAEARIPYGRLPGFPTTSVSGHAGELLVGLLGGTPVMVFSGRAHYYEGYTMEEVTFGVRVAAACGVRDLLLTNAAGGLNRAFRPGDFMVLSDHVNLIGANPLRGPALPGLPRFVDLTRTYDAELRRLLAQAGRKCGARVRSGVYLAACGPSYETPAEIHAFTRLGADAVGMSTVPEAIVARQCGLRVAALSCITNLAAGRSKQPLSHAEVLETAERVKDVAGQWMVEFAKAYGQEFGKREGAT
jgi:purine-nucleoside phosphorylase